MKQIIDFKIIDMDGDKYIAEIKTRHSGIGKRIVDTKDMGFFKKLFSLNTELYEYDNTYTVKAFKSDGRWVWETGESAPELANHEIVYWGEVRLKKLGIEEPPALIREEPDETRSI